VRGVRETPVVTRRLVLIRHATTEKNAASDAVRSLTMTGMADATAAGRWLVAENVTPDLVLVSPARRAVQTWDLAAAKLTQEPPSRSEGRIYDNTVEALLEVVRGAGPRVQTLAVVGHNPSIHALALDLDDGEGDPASRAELTRGYPAGSVAVFQIPSDWPDLDSGTATLESFATPQG
jgi:phosphohistidine phosphatase